MNTKLHGGSCKRDCVYVYYNETEESYNVSLEWFNTQLKRIMRESIKKY